MWDIQHFSFPPPRCLWPRVQAGVRPADGRPGEAYPQLRPAAQHGRDGVPQDVRRALPVESSAHSWSSAHSGAAQGNLETVNVHRDWTVRLCRLFFFFLKVLFYLYFFGVGCCFFCLFFLSFCFSSFFWGTFDGRNMADFFQWRWSCGGVEGGGGVKKHIKTISRKKREGGRFKKTKKSKKKKSIYYNV